MRKLLVAALMAGLLTFSGCALIESALYDQARDPVTGELEYVDVEATDALSDALKDDGYVVTVDESEKVPGKEYVPYYGSEPSGVVKGASGLLGVIPVWGGLLSSALTFLVGGLGAAFRGRKKLSAEKAKVAGFKVLGGELVQTLEDIKSGKLDTDGDGKVSLDEIKAYLVARGKKSVEPEKLEELVRIIDGTLEAANKVKES